MKETNHKISRQIVGFAIQNGVHLIPMEDLTGIRHSRKSKKKQDELCIVGPHYQLQQFIAYKAQMAGLLVEYVNPTYTSQMCKCGHVDKRNRNRNAFCCRKCGYRSHADINAAINISKAVSGLSEGEI